jgi:hypothetical protein
MHGQPNLKKQVLSIVLGWEKAGIIIDRTETSQAVDLMLVADSIARKCAQRMQNYFISNLSNIISLHLLNHYLIIVFPISTP